MRRVSWSLISNCQLEHGLDRLVLACKKVGSEPFHDFSPDLAAGLHNEEALELS